MTKKPNNSLHLLVSVILCVSIILFTQFFIFIPKTKDIKPINTFDSNLSDYAEVLKFFPPQVRILDCSNLVTGESIEQNTTCVIKPKDIIQTYSAVKIWNYTTQSWETPPENVPGEKTILDQEKLQDIVRGPVIMTCPWGCTMGYP